MQHTHPTKLESNIQIAHKTRKYCRRIIPTNASTSNPSIFDKPTLFSLKDNLQEARKRKIPLDEYAYYLLLYPNNIAWKEIKRDNKASKLYHHGNCGELSRLAINYLKKNNISKAEMVSIKDSDHAFVMIDREGSLDNPDPSTWGKSCVILDVLNNQVYPATEIYHHLQCYEFDITQDNPHILKNFTKSDRLQIEALVEYEKNLQNNIKQLENYNTKLNLVKNVCQLFLKDDFVLFEAALENVRIVDNKEDLSNLELERLLSKNIKRLIQEIIKIAPPAIRNQLFIEIFIQSYNDYPKPIEYFLEILYSEDFFQKIMFELEKRNDSYAEKIKAALFEKNLLRYILLSAHEAGKKEVVRYLLERNTYSDLSIKNDLTPLHLAALYGFEDLVGKFLKQGADPEANDKFNNTPLMIAIRSGNAKIVKLLLQPAYQKNSLYLACLGGWTPLHLSVFCKNEEITHFLLKLNADATALSDDGDTPLSVAIKNNDINMVKLLLLPEYHHNALHVATPGGWMPLHIAVYHKNKEIVKVLLKAGASAAAISDEGSTPLILAIKNEDTKMVELLLNHDNSQAALMIKNKEGFLPIHEAALQDSYKIIKILLEKDYSLINIQEENDQFAPIHFAAINGCHKTVYELLNAGCNSNLKDVNGYTPLMHAIIEGNIKTIKTFLEFPENDSILTFCDENGMLPIHLAAQESNPDIINIFLVNDTKHINASDKDGDTPLHHAILAGNAETVEALIKAGADPEIKNSKGETARSLAAKQKNGEIKELLLGSDNARFNFHTTL